MITPTVFGLAETDEHGAPIPELVRIWGMETEDGAILYWQDSEGLSQFGTFDSAECAGQRFAPLFGLALFHP